MNFNRATVAGNLTRDPEKNQLADLTTVVNFTIVSNRPYKNAQGEKVEESEFHPIVVYGKTAESCATYLKRGDLVLVEGRLRTRSWEKDGTKRNLTEIVANRVEFGPKRHAVGQEVRVESKQDEWEF